MDMNQRLRRVTIAAIATAAVSMGVSHTAQAATSANDAARARISDALSKGDAATADKLMMELQANQKPGAAAAVFPGGYTTYEEIKSCGLYPQETRLECTIEIKQNYGYGGGPAAIGSMEHVYFCVDWNGDGAYTQYESAGQGSVQMHDGPVPAEYAVYRDFNPFGGTRTGPGGVGVLTTTTAPVVNVKAILSWYYAPTGCNYVPFWGNIVVFPVRLDPIR